MKINKNTPINILCLLFFFSISTVHITESAAFEYYDWHTESIGYEIAKVDAEKKCTPFIIYFYLDSGEWTEKLNNEYIATDQVDKFLSGITNKVAIDADYDMKNDDLARDLGIDSFPAFLISIPCLNTEFYRVRPFSENTQMTTDEFIGEIKKFITSQYNMNAHSLYSEKNYEKALELLKKSIEFDTRTPYTYQLMGVIYHEIGAEKKDSDILKLAEENYKKALELDPENKVVSDELNKVIKHDEKD